MLKHKFRPRFIAPALTPPESVIDTPSSPVTDTKAITASGEETTPRPLAYALRFRTCYLPNLPCDGHTNSTKRFSSLPKDRENLFRKVVLSLDSFFFFLPQTSQFYCAHAHRFKVIRLIIIIIRSEEIYYSAFSTIKKIIKDPLFFSFSFSASIFFFTFNVKFYLFDNHDRNSIKYLRIIMNEFNSNRREFFSIKTIILSKKFNLPRNITYSVGPNGVFIYIIKKYSHVFLHTNMLLSFNVCSGNFKAHT